MTAEEFRNLALDLPEAVEAAHMGHPDFRVRGKIFATLGPSGGDWGMVKLTPEQQAAFARSAPDVFEPCNGAWGRQGSTYVRLAAAQVESVAEAVELAWRNATATAARRSTPASDSKPRRRAK